MMLGSQCSPCCDAPCYRTEQLPPCIEFTAPENWRWQTGCSCYYGQCTSPSVFLSGSLIRQPKNTVYDDFVASVSTNTLFGCSGVSSASLSSITIRLYCNPTTGETRYSSFGRLARDLLYGSNDANGRPNRVMEVLVGSEWIETTDLIGQMRQNAGGSFRVRFKFYCNTQFADSETFELCEIAHLVVDWPGVGSSGQEGACCKGTTCVVKPQCQCNAAAGEVFKGVGTVCSPNPCLICGCPEGDPDIPDYIDVTFSGFSLEYRAQTNTLSDMTGYESQLQSFLESLSLRFHLDIGSSVKSAYAAYRYAGGCYENSTVLFSSSIVSQISPCELSANCSDSGTLLDTSSSGFGRLYCNGGFEFSMNMRTPVGCWDAFPQNRQYYTLYYQFQGAGLLELCQGSISPFVTYPAVNNSGSGLFGSYPSSAKWSTGIYTSFYNEGIYTPIPSAEIRYTPHYANANPLP